MREKLLPVDHAGLVLTNNPLERFCLRPRAFFDPESVAELERDYDGSRAGATLRLRFRATSVDNPWCCTRTAQRTTLLATGWFMLIAGRIVVEQASACGGLQSAFRICIETGPSGAPGQTTRFGFVFSRPALASGAAASIAYFPCLINYFPPVVRLPWGRPA